MINKHIELQQIPIAFRQQFDPDCPKNSQQDVENALKRMEIWVFYNAAPDVLNDRQFVIRLLNEYPELMSSPCNLEWLYRWQHDGKVMAEAFLQEVHIPMRLMDDMDQMKANNRDFILSVAGKIECSWSHLDPKTV